MVAVAYGLLLRYVNQMRGDKAACPLQYCTALIMVLQDFPNSRTTLSFTRLCRSVHEILGDDEITLTR